MGENVKALRDLIDHRIVYDVYARGRYQDKFAGVVVDAYGQEWRFGDDTLQIHKVKFKTVCQE